MAQAIRVVVSHVYTYVPDLTDETYVQEGITTIDAALAADKADVESGDFSVDEISAKDPTTTYVWSIIDE